MEILVQVKSAGKRRPILEQRPVQVPNGISTLRDLISAIVEGEVAACAMSSSPPGWTQQNSCPP